jgi:putative membrane protein
MMGFGIIWMLLFWGGLIALAVWLIGLLFPPVKKQAGDDDRVPSSAQEILKTRYARGELTSDQYQEMRQTLDQ